MKTIAFSTDALTPSLGPLTWAERLAVLRFLKTASIRDQAFEQAQEIRDLEVACEAEAKHDVPIRVDVRSSSSCDGWTARTKTKPVCTASSTSCAYSAAAAAAAKHFGCERRRVALSTTLDDMPAWNKPGHFSASAI